MIKLNIAYVDDDKFSLEAAGASIIQAFENNGVEIELKSYSKAKLFLDDLQKNNYDLVFFDIDMPEMDGIELGKKVVELKKTFDIVFLSAMEDRVFDSLIVHPFGFVRKSAFSRDLNEIVGRYSNKLKSRDEEGSIDIVTKGSIIHLQSHSILYIEAYGDYQNVYQKGVKESLTLSSSMNYLDDNVKKFGFIRIHKRYLVNYEHIQMIGNKEVIMDNGDKLPIARRKLQEVREEYLKLLNTKSSSIVV